MLAICVAAEPRHHAIQLPKLDIMIIGPLQGQIDGNVIVSTIDFDFADETAGTRNDIEAVVLHRSAPLLWIPACVAFGRLR
ncbi:hypothetical protein [Bradyrhizobium sp.]|uniref:hypothetical protein n=1 Tax=Bradyrhizobium sp. TaxID=376 RepID=UPI003C6F4AB3